MCFSRAQSQQTQYNFVYKLEEKFVLIYLHFLLNFKKALPPKHFKGWGGEDFFLGNFIYPLKYHAFCKHSSNV